MRAEYLDVCGPMREAGCVPGPEVSPHRATVLVWPALSHPTFQLGTQPRSLLGDITPRHHWRGLSPAQPTGQQVQSQPDDDPELLHTKLRLQFVLLLCLHFQQKENGKRQRNMKDMTID